MQIFRSHVGSFFCASNFTIIFSKTVKLKYPEDIKQLVTENTFSVRNHRSVLLQNKCRTKKRIKTSTKELLSKTTG